MKLVPEDFNPVPKDGDGRGMNANDCMCIAENHIQGKKRKAQFLLHV